MDFYTVVLKQNESYWLALCLENGLIGQSRIKESAVQKLKEAIESFEEVHEVERDVHSSPLSIKELHEFLSLSGGKPVSETYELRAVSA